MYNDKPWNTLVSWGYITSVYTLLWLIADWIWSVLPIWFIGTTLLIWIYHNNHGLMIFLILYQFWHRQRNQIWDFPSIFWWMRNNEWPQIWHSDVRRPPSKMIISCLWSVDLSHFGTISIFVNQMWENWCQEGAEAYLWCFASSSVYLNQYSYKVDCFVDLFSAK